MGFIENNRSSMEWCGVSRPIPASEPIDSKILLKILQFGSLESPAFESYFNEDHVGIQMKKTSKTLSMPLFTAWLSAEEAVKTRKLHRDAARAAARHIDAEEQDNIDTAAALEHLNDDVQDGAGWDFLGCRRGSCGGCRQSSSLNQGQHNQRHGCQQRRRTKRGNCTENAARAAARHIDDNIDAEEQDNIDTDCCTRAFE
ncbi:hypothetical protein JTE90_025536 [Oedothorax gibbosus]|uniref:Uncharacterized protein n=1 Tax=Oedothorax gibbosus TaxID=931172 RepID=A0AAV6TWD2_9ARAC|nr:hypothetical protein JTE90_025536 [Oedothorax gibbosus]